MSQSHITQAFVNASSRADQSIRFAPRMAKRCRIGVDGLQMTEGTAIGARISLIDSHSKLLACRHASNGLSPVGG